MLAYVCIKKIASYELHNLLMFAYNNNKWLLYVHQINYVNAEKNACLQEIVKRLPESKGKNFF